MRAVCNAPFAGGYLIRRHFGPSTEALQIELRYTTYIVGEAGAAFPLIEEVVHRAIAAICAEMVGTMEEMHAQNGRVS
ncbi:hypothetical protein CQ10_38770 [Bradyrhizobium valentinum]|nr:hypothetical protein CQ10_38770 [Bradyrhizobium valentinum]